MDIGMVVDHPVTHADFDYTVTEKLVSLVGVETGSLRHSDGVESDPGSMPDICELLQRLAETQKRR